MTTSLRKSQDTGSDFTVEHIDDLPGLVALAPEWRELWRRLPAATPFQSPGWLIAWYACFRPGPLRCVAVIFQRRLVGLAPFYAEDGPGGRRLLPLGISVSDHHDVLVDPMYEAATGALLLKHLLQPPYEGTLCCEELREDSAALRMWGQSEWLRARNSQSACPVLPLVRSFETQIPRHKLRKLRMARHRIERHGGAIITPTQDAACGLIAELFRLHAARWTNRGEAGVLADERLRHFHETVLPALLDENLLRLYGLYIGGILAGAYYGFHWRERAYAYLGGFDPAFAYHSPGTVLIGHAIEEALREGASEFHFLRGREAYKYEWGASDRWNARLELRREP